jgi:hypothetical protein
VDRCFVIQPFDGGKFDKRYDDVIAPAIAEADLEPYRVDRDSKVSIPIEDIQSGIELSRVCLADITTDNPNVWFELGYAIASQRDVVLICSDERTSRFPFDVQHRSIIKYSTESPRDFDQLSKSITARLAAILQKEGQLQSFSRMSPVAAVEGLEQFEIAALISAAQQLPDPNGSVATYLIQQDMDRAGFTEIATTLAVRGLISKKMLEAFEEQDWRNENYTVYRVTDEGMAWLRNNTDKLKLRAEPPLLPAMPPNDEIPF